MSVIARYLLGIGGVIWFVITVEDTSKEVLWN